MSPSTGRHARVAAARQRSEDLDHDQDASFELNEPDAYREEALRLKHGGEVVVCRRARRACSR
jgi:hypothetical protein